MKKASVVSIGNELLNGQTADTNLLWLSEKLLSFGVPTVSSYTVIDDVDMIKNAVEMAARDADFIMITGGLGPTDDDITRQAIAKFLNVQVEFKQNLLDDIKEYFAKKNRTMPEKNIVQAYLPKTTMSLANDLGTAPGIMFKKDGKLFAAMAGVPAEMKHVFDRHIADEISSIADNQAVVIKKLKCVGTGESNLAQMLGDMMNRNNNPLLHCTVCQVFISLYVIATSPDRVASDKMAKKQCDKLKKLLGQLVFDDKGKELSQVVGEMLAKREMTVAVAESSSGGLIAKMLTDYSGASDYFNYGWVTYSNNAKEELLGVSAQTLEKYGAVSVDVAKEMARGAKKIAKADFAIAVTGIAGPTGQTDNKPVGTTCICVSGKRNCQTKQVVFGKNRKINRKLTAQTALNMLRLMLLID